MRQKNLPHPSSRKDKKRVKDQQRKNTKKREIRITVVSFRIRLDCFTPKPSHHDPHLLW